VLARRGRLAMMVSGNASDVRRRKLPEARAGVVGTMAFQIMMLPSSEALQNISACTDTAVMRPKCTASSCCVWMAVGSYSVLVVSHQRPRTERYDTRTPFRHTSMVLSSAALTTWLPNLTRCETTAE